MTEGEEPEEEGEEPEGEGEEPEEEGDDGAGRRSQKQCASGFNYTVLMVALCLSDTVLNRFYSTLQFCSVLLSALLDSLTAWLNSLCQEHIDISNVLRIERCILTQQAKQVNGRDYNSPSPELGNYEHGGRVSFHGSP